MLSGESCKARGMELRWATGSNNRDAFTAAAAARNFASRIHPGATPPGSTPGGQIAPRTHLPIDGFEQLLKSGPPPS